MWILRLICSCKQMLASNETIYHKSSLKANLNGKILLPIIASHFHKKTAWQVIIKKKKKTLPQKFKQKPKFCHAERSEVSTQNTESGTLNTECGFFAAACALQAAWSLRLK